MVEYHKSLHIGRFSVKLPLRVGMRTTSTEAHRNLIYRLNMHVEEATADALGTTISTSAAVSWATRRLAAGSMNLLRAGDAGGVREGPASAAQEGAPVRSLWQALRITRPTRVEVASVQSAMPPGPTFVAGLRDSIEAGQPQP